MSATRENLQEALSSYTIDTLKYIDTVREFCETLPEWKDAREKELIKIKAIISMTKDTANKYEDLVKELKEELKVTLKGLKTLDQFLDAVEKLAVTSLYVFVENQMILLPRGISLQQVTAVIEAAQNVCPVLLEFKRDAEAFFTPKLHCVEVLSDQLEKYIETAELISEKFEKSSIKKFPSFNHPFLRMIKNTIVKLYVDLSGNETQTMLQHLNQLEDIRMNHDFRMVFLFQEMSCSDFISQFKERHPRMLKFLEELEEKAVQLDKMSKGAKISSVAGSSVGVLGGILSIIAFILIPVTAGVSLVLTAAAAGMGITSGVNDLVTTSVEIGVNSKHQNKSSEIFQRLLEDVQSLQDCLDKVMKQNITRIEISKLDVTVAAGKIAEYVGTVGKGINSIVDGASTIKALTKGARLGLSPLKPFFIGMDIFSICTDSISLAEGVKSEFSQLIRDRCAVLKSEMDSWQKIYDSLCEGLKKSEKYQAILETPFYPEKNFSDLKRVKICVLISFFSIFFIFYYYFILSRDGEIEMEISLIDEISFK